MKENIDINTGSIVDGAVSIDEMGEVIFRAVLETASGQKTKAELLGHDELFCITRK